MSTIEVVSFVLIIIGAAFIFASFLPARKTWKKVPDELRSRWHTIVYLMYFFFIGYIFFDFILLIDLKLPVELVTGGVFFGGAIFVYIVIKLSQHTITRVQETEQELKALNEALEQRVAERTRELQRSFEFSQTVLNSMNDPISIIDVNTHQIVGINSAFLREFGFREEEVMGKTCHEVTHRQSEPCKPHMISAPLWKQCQRAAMLQWSMCTLIITAKKHILKSSPHRSKMKKGRSYRPFTSQGTSPSENRRKNRSVSWPIMTT